MSTENVAVVCRWFHEVWNQRRPETIDELMAADAVCEGEGKPITGPKEFRARFYDPLTSAFTRTPVELEVVICQGEDVVVRWSSTATHDGPGLGVPASGKQVTMRGITRMRVRGSKLIEGWQSSNLDEVVRGLTAVS